ncbi:MAG: hypothetical protein E6Q94_04625 [Burkholderiaceae bacterium]|nr:MAG: hypothetical protein E6Q94_04625 [Burkholderiaceae bacterium]
MPQGLSVLHLHRGLLGWKRAHEERLVLSDHDNDLTAVQTPLTELLKAWEVPESVGAIWVLAGDVLGVTLPPQGSTGPALPFPPNEVRTHSDGYSDSPNSTQTQRSVLWMHKDWVAEIERISSSCGLELVELFGRGQLFQPWVAQHPNALRVLVESEGGDHFLHIYAASGKLLRTRVLNDGHARVVQDPDAFRTLLKVEMLSLTSSQNTGDIPIQLITSADLANHNAKGWESALERVVLPQRPPGDWLWGLWRSALEGIAVRPQHHTLVKSLTMGSAVFGVVGLLTLAGFAWDNNRLEAQVGTDRALARRQLPRVEVAQAQRLQALRMDDVVRAASPSPAQGDAFDTLLRGLAGFPPPPATLLYLQATPDTLVFVANGNASSQQWLKDKPAEGFTPYTEFTVPAALSESQPEIHLQARRLPPTAMASPTAPPTTAHQSSQP